LKELPEDLDRISRPFLQSCSFSGLISSLVATFASVFHLKIKLGKCTLIKTVLSKILWLLQNLLVYKLALFKYTQNNSLKNNNFIFTVIAFSYLMISPTPKK